MQNRRQFLTRLVLAGAAASVPGLLAACGEDQPAAGGANGEASGEPIRIGGMWLLSGALSAYGDFAREGADLAVSQINEAGGVAGRPIEMLYAHEGSADDVVQVARRLAFQEEVDFLMGIDSSGTAQALAPNVPDLGKVLMLTHAASGKLTGELCNRFVFRCSVNIPQNTYAAAAIAAEEYPDITQWATVGPDYAFGYEVWENFQAQLLERNPDATFTEPIYPPFGNEDFSSHIGQALDSGAPGLLVSVWGADLVNFVRQAADFGLFEQVTPVFMLGAAMEVLEGAGDLMPTGFWAGTRYWWGVPETDVNSSFVEAYRQAYDHPPSYNAQGAYTGVQMLARAVEEAGGTKTDAVIEALEGMEYEAPQGPTLIRPEDHQAVVDVTWGVLAEGDEGFRVLEPTRVFPGAEAIPDVSETGCELA